LLLEAQKPGEEGNEAFKKLRMFNAIDPKVLADARRVDAQTKVEFLRGLSGVAIDAAQAVEIVAQRLAGLGQNLKIQAAEGGLKLDGTEHRREETQRQREETQRKREREQVQYRHETAVGEYDRTIELRNKSVEDDANIVKVKDARHELNKLDQKRFFDDMNLKLERLKFAATVQRQTVLANFNLPAVKYTAIGAALLIAVANVVDDNPEYRGTPVLHQINSVWDAAYDPIYEGIVYKFQRWFKTSEAPELVPTSRLALQLPAPPEQVQDTFRAAEAPSTGLDLSLS